MTEFFTWVNAYLDFPQLSFLKPVLVIPLIMLAVDLTFGFIFSLFSKFFGK